MKRLFTTCMLVAIALFASACGSSVAIATLPPAASVTASAIPAQPGTAASLPATSAPNGTEVDIKLADNTIESSLTTFKVGVPYTFVIQNTGRHTHNFNISTPVSVAGSLDAALSGALLSVTRDKLSSGANTSVQYTFPDSAAGQKLEFSCLIKMHYEDGMYLAITVTK